MSFWNVTFSGGSHGTSVLTSAPVEIWACSLGLITDAAAVPTQARCDDVANAIRAWFVDTDTKIGSTESLDVVKVNAVDLVTGHQITDPTMQTNFSAVRGSADAQVPLGYTYRISMSDGTRNPRARGGFYPPRVSYRPLENGRLDSLQRTAYTDSAVRLISALNNIVAPVQRVGVWSRREKAVFPVTTLRVGDVSDNISRRRNHLIEAYDTRAIVG